MLWQQSLWKLQSDTFWSLEQKLIQILTFCAILICTYELMEARE